MNSICVFCGSNTGNSSKFTYTAQEMAKTLVTHRLSLVYGGGSVGLMGVLADQVLALGGKVCGVIPKGIFTKELAHEGLTQLHVVGTMHERKQLMYDLADGFIALPGGLGTLEELCEILTWAQLGFHQKPCGILNVAGYFDSLLQFFDDAVKHRFVRPEHRDLILTDESPEGLLQKLKDYRPPKLKKWIKKGEV
jgi:uncharacterized protein (TIGR00730 family)